MVLHAASSGGAWSTQWFCMLRVVVVLVVQSGSACCVECIVVCMLLEVLVGFIFAPGCCSVHLRINYISQHVLYL